MADHPEPGTPEGESADEVPEVVEAPDTQPSQSSVWWPVLAIVGASLPALLGGVLKLLGIQSSRVAAAPVVLAIALGMTLAVRKTFKDRALSLRTRLLVGTTLTVLLAASVAVAVVFRPPPAATELPRLHGGLDVAVIGFESVGTNQDQAVLDDVSDTFTNALKGRLPKRSTALDYAGQTSPPLAELAQSDQSALNRWTTSFVDQSNAAIVIGGLVSTDPSGQITLQPAFYVRAEQVVNAPELTGWYLSDLSSGIRLDQDLGSESARGLVVDELVRRTSGLAAFTHALDLLQVGNVVGAKSELDPLLPSSKGGLSQNGSEFVTGDLVRLFHGHALEQIAVGLPGAQRKPDFEAARTDYQAIDPGHPEDPIRLRARLSLAGTQYQLALGPSPSCHVGTVDSTALAAASAELRQLAADGNFSLIGRLRASVNLAQVEQCRVTAHLVADDGTIDQALQRVRASTDDSAVKELQPLADSVAAVHAAGLGDLVGAIADIREAITAERGFALRGLWQGLAAAWEFQRADLSSGCQDMQGSLNQLGDAKGNGEITQERYDELRAALNQQADAAGARCAQATPGR
jgi:hypothetical protein